MDALAQILQIVKQQMNNPQPGAAKGDGLWGKVEDQDGWFSLEKAQWFSGRIAGRRCTMFRDLHLEFAAKEGGELVVGKVKPDVVVKRGDSGLIVKLARVETPWGQYALWLNTEKQGERTFFGVSKDAGKPQGSVLFCAR